MKQTAKCTVNVWGSRSYDVF